MAASASCLAHRVSLVRANLTAWTVTYSGVTINAITARQIRIPSRLQGRVNTTARLLGWGIGWPIGAAIAGVLARALGVRTTYLLAAAGLALLAGTVTRAGGTRRRGGHASAWRGGQGRLRAR
jgi:hypothetical protein